MSIYFSNITSDYKTKIKKELLIKVEGKYQSQTKYIKPYEFIETDCIIPFNYACSILNVKKPSRLNYSKTKIKFEAEPREEQKIVLTEALDNLNKNGSVLISAYCGFGKTVTAIKLATYTKLKTVIVVNKLVLMTQWEQSILKFCPSVSVLQLKKNNQKIDDCDFVIINAQNIEKMGQEKLRDFGNVIVDECFPSDTPIMMSEKNTKYIKDIVKGDTVLSFNKELGVFQTSYVIETFCKKIDDPLIEIVYNSGKKIKCTYNHEILTVDGYKQAMYLKKGDFCLCYSNKILNPILNYDQEQLLFGIILSNYKNIYYHNNVLSYKSENLYKKKCQEYNDWKKYVFNNNEEISIDFDIEQLNINKQTLAIWYIESVLDTLMPNLLSIRLTLFSKISLFIRKLYRIGIDTHIYEYKGYPYLIISVSSLNTLNDILSEYIPTNILKLLKMNNNVSKYVWNTNFLKYRIDIVRKINHGSGYIMKKVHDIQVYPNNNYIVHETQIVHNCHLIMAETLSKSLLYLYPRYLIGLSATPYRTDGLTKLLDFYFGTNKIVRKFSREHIVYNVETKIKLDYEYNDKGVVNWNSLLDSQATNKERNNLIVNIVKHFSEYNFLILVKRVSQGKYLESKLLEEKENVTSLLGNNQNFDSSSRILIGTNSKIGVGFDHSKLNALLLACDIEQYFIQYLGRVFRTKNTIPIIVDIVDDNNLLKKHYNTRKSIYKEHGGKIEKLNFDNFK